MKNETDKVTTSSGNVFADLGFKNPEEEQAKAGLVRVLRKIIKDRGLTQKANKRAKGAIMVKAA
ncbi:MAG: XRE family transcriptional regulator [Rhodospirillaceae bacterium]|jgi:hypothetical protein|nr:XRE family transcriptional regulator [Rhodospirillaceae bacterium]